MGAIDLIYKNRIFPLFKYQLFCIGCHEFMEFDTGINKTHKDGTGTEVEIHKCPKCENVIAIGFIDYKTTPNIGEGRDNHGGPKEKASPGT